MAILCYLIDKKDPNFNLAHCYYYSDCSKEDLTKYINRTDHCEKNSTCYNELCSFCLGLADKTFDNCLRQSFDQCLLCDSPILETSCYKDLSECPNGYEDIQEIADFFWNPRWCLKEATYCSKSKYKEIIVDS